MELQQLIFSLPARDKSSKKLISEESMPANALVLLAEGAEEMETVIAVDVLRYKLFFQDYSVFSID